MDRLERLVNLVAALIETPRPLSRAEIRERTPGYSADPTAFRRNFERDKDLLRQMGFPIVTEAPDPSHPEEVGYRIPRDQYELPDPGLDETELTALRLAASAVQLDADWGESAVVQALRKLGGAPSPGADPTAALPVDERAAALLGAVGERRKVRFRYRDEDRVVDPWRLSYHGGHWYLSGWDNARVSERMFRLDRIDGSVSPEGPAGAFDRRSVTQVGPPKPWQLGEGEGQVASLVVDAAQAAWARQELGAEAVRDTRADGSVVFEVEVTNPDAFRSFVLGFLDHAEVIAPADLRQELVAWLGRLADEAAS